MKNAEIRYGESTGNLIYVSVKTPTGIREGKGFTLHDAVLAAGFVISMHPDRTYTVSGHGVNFAGATLSGALMSKGDA